MSSPGKLIAEARAAAGLTLREVGEALGVSIPFLHDLERDKRRLSSVHWSALAKRLPDLDMRALIAAMLESGSVTVDARGVMDLERIELTMALTKAFCGR